MTPLDHRLLFAQDFALLNPLQIENSLWSDLPVTPLLSEETRSQPQLVPQLLELRSLGDAERVELLERSDRHQRGSRHPYFSALLSTDATFDEVRAQLARHLMITAPDQTRALLRYYDPRVFKHLRWLLSEDQLNLLLGRIDTWHWQGGRGGWSNHRRCGTSLLSRLYLQPEQWSTLQRLGLLNKSLQQIRRHLPDTTDDASLARRTDGFLDAAHQHYGLTDAADRCLFAVQAIVYHPAIHTHPQLLQRLARTREATSSYVGACRDLTPPTLRSLAAELAPPTRTLA